jgi:ABC-type bacteriocin/lantibiotic exporter with double-glycine peptidase domain
MLIQQERDRRARLMSEALESIRLLKSLQWEPFAASVLQAARAREVRGQVRRQACFGGNGALAQLAQVMGPLAAFACRVLVEGRPLTASVAFTSLAWFNLLKRPLNLFPTALTSLLDCLVSWERLEAFFLADDTSPPPTTLSTPSSPSSLMSSTKAGGAEAGGVAKALEGEDSPWAIDLRGCTFSWTKEGPPALRDVRLRVCRGELVVVVGPVGSGELHAAPLRGTGASRRLVCD